MIQGNREMSIHMKGENSAYQKHYIPKIGRIAEGI